MRTVILALSVSVSVSACAYAPIPGAPENTQARWQRIMDQMRADSAERAREGTARADAAASMKSSVPLDAAMPAGIDISRFELPIHYNERVQQYIDLYANRRRSVFIAWLRKSGRYRDYIQQRLVEHGLPKELVYLPLIESGYETAATSDASAVGLWQFMSGTARAEGLEVSEYVDERRDPFKSTDAAVRHLAGLYNTFGSWYLSAAAYNSGSGRIGRLMKESFGAVKGPDARFWEIQDRVPTETRGYVPGLIAATIIGEYPQLFGMDGLRLDPPLRFEIVTVPASTNLRAVAKAAGVPVEDIRALNPQYFRGLTPPGRESPVRVPPGTSAEFQAAFENIATEQRILLPARTHTVRRGETLSEIAEHYGVTLEALTKANRIKRPSAITAGRKLTIPSPVSHEVYGTD